MSSINILESTPVPIPKVPAWVLENVGFKPNRSTVFRWETRGCRGRKLKTFRAGGRKFTTVEALLEFFSDEDESDANNVDVVSGSMTDAESYLASEGI